MELRRIDGLPPYVFSQVDAVKLELRREGCDVVDLGFGNPDLASPTEVVDKLCEAARNPRNHRYSASRGIPRLRRALADMYMRRFGVELDPDTEVITTIGAKEGIAHLMWVLLQPGDGALVPTPTYPIHFYAPLFAGADVSTVPLRVDIDFFEALREAYERQWPRPRVVLVSFPHNPTTACVDRSFFERLVAFAQEHEIVLVHDFAYADLVFDGYRAPSLLEVEGAKDVGVELYTLSKSYSMPGWRVGFVVGNAKIVQGLAKLKSYLDYGTFQPIQIASIIALNELADYPKAVADVYRLRRDALCNGLERIGWKVEKPKGSMFVWAPIPEPYKEIGSLDFAFKLLREACVSVSPGVGFGQGGEGWVRFALVENEHRIAQAVRGIKRALKELHQ
ncbi:MAG: alanine transaminase [Acidimicrobiia bacterium]